MIMMYKGINIKKINTLGFVLASTFCQTAHYMLLLSTDVSNHCLYTNLFDMSLHARVVEGGGGWCGGM